MMFKLFKLKGNVFFAVRSEKQMEKIDKKAADNAFKIQKKKFGAFLKEKGFFRYKTNAYIRRNKADVLEYIDLQKERYGSKTFTVNYAIMPLYVPHDFLSFDLGDRLGTMICGKDVWWDYSNEDVAEVSFQNVADAIERFLLPWFEKCSESEEIKKELLKEQKKRKKYGGQLSVYQQKWLDVVDDPVHDEEIINENIRVLELPRGIKG